MRYSFTGRITFNTLKARLVKLREPLWAVSSQVITSAGNFLTSILIVRSTGITEFGRFSVAFLILMISRNYQNGIVLIPLSTIAPKLRPQAASAYRGFILANGIAFTMITSLLIYVFSSFLGGFFNSPWLPNLALPLACANVSANLADLFRRYELVRQAGAKACSIDVIRHGATVVSLSTWPYWASSELNAQSALFVLAAASLIASAVGFLAFGKVCWSTKLSRALWPRHANFIRWMTPSVTLEAIQGTGPMFIGAFILGEADLGIVRAVQQFTNLLNLPANAAQQLVPSVASRVLHKKGPDSANKLLKFVAIASVTVAISLSIIIIFAWPFISKNLLHVNNPQSLWILLCFSLVNLIIALRVPLLAYFYIFEKPDAQAKSLIPGAILTIVLTFALTWAIGPIGIPTAIFLSLAVSTYILILVALRMRSRANLMKDTTSADSAVA